MESRAKSAAFKLIARMGYTVIPTWRVDRFAQTKYVKRLIDYLSIDCVIDVGANVGQYARYIRDEVGFRGLIVSFEPIPAHAATLHADAAGDERWQVEQSALGRVAGTQTFHVTANTEFSSFLATDPSFRQFEELTATAEDIAVPVRTLDEVVPEIRERFGVRNIHLKLDTQGYDLEVMAGGKSALGGLASLQSELAVQKIYDGMPDFRDSTRIIEEHGFVISQFFPNNEGHFPKLIEFDCYAIHHSRIGAAPTNA